MPKGELQLKKIVLTFIVALIFVALAGTTAFAKSEIIKVNADNCTVSINYDTTNYSDLKVVVKKGSDKYIYNLNSSNEELPLQMGNGEYTVGIYKRADGNKYKLLTSSKVHNDTTNNTVFLASVQNVHWTSNSNAAILAKELTKDAKTDREKIEVIYNYIIDNVKYDDEKAKNVSSRYLPSTNETLASEKGICYDYASLFAVMLRSLNIPTKLVHGDSNFTSVYHAWNEVLVDNNWIVVDTTIDAAYKSEGVKVSYEKDPSDYSAKKVF
ncbi:transglutaminase-like domain-containing protein [Vallitalea guaymasensis]|uniref:transglutaminase-like domain-containing protein n=1 Tax=Vallitalea guaymasensis TaxID=1185412 RepID=UPI000DE2A61E|nr:transglutaminase-like domain-containing protein [Vallitalea guaymasensis]